MGFLIAEDGDLLDVCRMRIVAEKLPVVILGWQSNIERVLLAADIVVLTSDNEGAPLRLIQAGMARLPVVTTNVGSVLKVVINSVNGVTTELVVRQTADALENLVGHPGIGAQLSKLA